MELKRMIAEDTSVDTDHQVLFTQNGHKLKTLSHPLSHSSYQNDLFIPSNSAESKSDDAESTTFTIGMPPLRTAHLLRAVLTMEPNRLIV